MNDKQDSFKRLGCKVCGEVFFISQEAYKKEIGLIVQTVEMKCIKNN